MSLPHEPDERATLPVVVMPAGQSPLLDALNDRCFLEREGIIPEDPSIPLEASVDLVVGLGLAGVYRDHVRATGQVYRCPDWCTAKDHPRAGIWDARLDGIAHATDEFTLEGGDADDFVVRVEQFEGEAPTVMVYSDLQELTAAGARQVAAALLNAADVLDRIGGEL